MRNSLRAPLCCALLSAACQQQVAPTLMTPDASLDVTADVAPDVAPDAAPLSFRGQSLGEPDMALTDVDVVGYDVSFTLDDDTAGSEAFHASCTAVMLATRDLSAFTLDFDGNEIDAVTVGDVAAQYTRDAGRLTVTLPRAVRAREGFAVTVRYHGAVRRGTTGSGFNTNGAMMVYAQTTARPRIYMSLDWPTNARRWLPVRDHPRDGAMVAVRATFPSDYTVLSNGRRVSMSDNGDGTRTWQYEALTPMPIYDLHLAASAGWTETALAPAANGVAIRHYDYRASVANATTAFAVLPAAMDYFATNFGPFRWDGLAYLQEPAIGGGMEHATVVSLDDSLYRAPGTNREVAVHEMAHHWNGNLLRIATWNDLWVSEGFCDYFMASFVADHGGASETRRIWRELLRQGLNAEHAATPAALLPLRAADPERAPLTVFSSVVYKKGAWVLHMLERRVGRDRFREFLRGWYMRHAYQAVDTATLQREAAQALGDDVNAYFDQWVYAPMHPVLTVDARPDGDMLEVTVTQAQTVGPDGGFRLPVEIEFVGPSSTVRQTVTLTGVRTVARVPVAFTPTRVRVDPDNTLYLTTTCDASHPCGASDTCTTGTGSHLAVCVPVAEPPA